MIRILSATAILMAGPAMGQLQVPGFDAARVSAIHAAGMDLGSGKGDFSMTRFEARSVLVNDALSPGDGWLILPFLDYRFTALDFDAAPAPFKDEDLHSISLNSVFLRMCEGSPWIFGGWARAELASDFRHIDGDDFTFDLAAGVGYRFSPEFSLGVGAGVINLNGDEQIYPGLAMDWIVNEQLRVGIYGPLLVAVWALDDDWLFSLRGDPSGGVWNVTDPAGESRSIDFSSYRVGLFASRRLGGNFWLTAGGGVTLANEIDYTTSSGRKISGLDPDTGIFGLVSVRLKAW